MKKIFGNLKMTWPAVILFALATGVYTGLIMLVKPLENTSFQDIGITFEWWVLFAVIVVVNCQKGWEAALKCFVFFLISQPVIYLTQVIPGRLSFQMAKDYYFSRWFAITFLTLPGGWIAWFAKKQNVLGSVVLALGCSIQLGLGLYFATQAITYFPHHLLSTLFCFGSVVLMVLCIRQGKKRRLLTFVLSLLFTALLLLGLKVLGYAIV